MRLVRSAICCGGRRARGVVRGQAGKTWLVVPAVQKRGFLYLVAIIGRARRRKRELAWLRLSHDLG